MCKWSPYGGFQAVVQLARDMGACEFEFSVQKKKKKKKGLHLSVIWTLADLDCRTGGPDRFMNLGPKVVYIVKPIV